MSKNIEECRGVYEEDNKKGTIIREKDPYEIDA